MLLERRSKKSRCLRVKPGAMTGNCDLNIVLHLNALVPAHDLGARLLYAAGANFYVRGIPVFVPLVALWFAPRTDNRRGRMMVGMLAAALATIISVWLQYVLLLHIRPFLDPALHLRSMDGLQDLAHRWDRQGSFPSDTATLFFAVSTVVFLESRLAGSIAILWSLLTVGLVRVAFGFHYPSDIAGSFILGPGTVILLTRVRHFTDWTNQWLQRREPRINVVHAVFFLFAADAAHLFTGLESILKGMRAVMHVVVR